MTYTVSFDLFVDGDEVLSETEIKEFLKEELDSSAIGVNNIKLIEIND